jgi:hypothetical protein
MIDWSADPVTMSWLADPARTATSAAPARDLVVVGFFRHVEHFGDGCEAAIFDV